MTINRHVTSDSALSIPALPTEGRTSSLQQLRLPGERTTVKIAGTAVQKKADRE